MALTIQNMKDYVRLHADADPTDAPDGNLETYARMAYYDILSRRGSWPHLEVRYTLTTVAGTRDYAISGLTGGTDMERVMSISRTDQLGGRIVYITPTDQDVYFPGVPPIANTYAQAYTILGQTTIRLFPSPAAVITYTVAGFRSPAAWPTTAGSIPDLPLRFQDAIPHYMLYMYYMSQEDLNNAQTYLGQYQQMVQNQLDYESNRQVTPRPLIMGANSQYRYPSFMEIAKGSCE